MIHNAADPPSSLTKSKRLERSAVSDDDVHEHTVSGTTQGVMAMIDGHCAAMIGESMMCPKALVGLRARKQGRSGKLETNGGSLQPKEEVTRNGLGFGKWRKVTMCLEIVLFG
jgi:hypothetical protein